ncbi:MAG: hypothetical protein AB9882_01285 [Ignavibacteriaceae bacterium]
MNTNILTNLIALAILILSMIYVYLVFPAIDYFQLILAFFLSVSNFLTGKEIKKNDIW